MLTSGTRRRVERMPYAVWYPGVPYNWLLPPVPPPAANAMADCPSTTRGSIGAMPMEVRSFHGA